MTLLTKIQKFKEGELQILKQSKSSFQGKIYLGKKDNIPQYKYKSIKTISVDEAVKKLTNWYHEVKYLSNTNQIEQLYPTKNKAKKLIEQYLKDHIFKNEKSKKDDISNSKNIINFLETHNVDDFTKKSLIDLKSFLLNKPFKNNTVRHHFMLLRRMYRDLLNSEKITKDRIPDFPKLLKNSSQITYLSFDQYKTLMNISETRIKQTGLSRKSQLARKSLHYYIQFICGCGLRRSEASKLQFKDIKIDYDKIDKSYSLEIHVKNGKTGSRIVVSKPSSYYAFLNLKNIYSQYSDIIDFNEDASVFPRDFRKSAHELFKIAGVDIDENGYKLDLTALRKTYICWGLINGEKIFDIAINCGNSPEIIKTNYADKLTSVALKHRLRKFKVYTTNYTTA